MIAKARTLATDEVILDLEDSVPPDQKARARQTVIAALRDDDWATPMVGVRINGTGTRWCHRDVIELIEGAGDRLASLIVPKVESGADVEFVAHLASLVEQETARRQPVGLELLVETAAGLGNVRDAARASDRVQALVVGYADLAASLGRPVAITDDPHGMRWRWVLETVLVAARDAGVQAIDGPHFEIADLEGLRARAALAATLGYDGKWALHPTQIEPLNDAFSPTQDEFDSSSALLAELDRGAAASGRGAVLHDGEMIDEASAKRARELVARGTAAGLGPT